MTSEEREKPDENARRVLPDDLVKAFIRLAQGDFTVRLERNFRRDTDDALAFFVNVIAEQLAKLTSERERVHADLTAGVARLSKLLRALVAGQFDVRAERTGKGDLVDALARTFNEVAEEVGSVFADREKQRAVLEATLESMVDGVVLVGPNATIQRTNGAMARMLGHDARALVGASMHEVLDASEAPFAARLRDPSRTSSFQNRDTLFRTASGESISIAVNGSPHRGADGTVLGVVLVARDERELKKAQTQLMVTDRLATMGAVVAGVAHEINNPLAFVLSNLQYVREEWAELSQKGRLSNERIAEIGRALTASHDGAQRIKRIVGDLRTFSRSDAEIPEPVEIDEIVEAAFTLVQNEIRHHARVVKEYGAPPPVLATEGRLVQVFVNLLQNAAQAIPVGDVERNCVRIVTGTDAQREVFVEIHDTGAGIPDSALPHMFDLFFTTKPVGAGTGLGLSICHRIVDGLGGRIEVESRVGVGSCFRVVLPAADADEVASPKTLSDRPPSYERDVRVLVVDDEREIGESIQRVLRGVPVDATTSPLEALELVRTRDYDVILCDLLMPEMTGMEFHAQLERHDPALARRVVFMTGGSFGAGVREFLDRVPNGRLEKPFDARDVLPLVRRGV